MWYIALSLGMVGSLHCLGMCGPIALALCDKRQSGAWSIQKTAIRYHLGRSLTYMIIGWLFGTFGYIARLLAVQSILSIIMGMILIGGVVISYRGRWGLSTSAIISKWSRLYQKWLSWIITKRATIPSFILGMSNGLLPCGLVYVALAGALTMVRPVDGALFMLVFGLSTIPAFLVLSMISGYNYVQGRRILKKALPAVQILFGVYLIYRGYAVHYDPDQVFWDALLKPLHCLP